MESLKKGTRGFTLVEILIVLAVLAILGAVVVPNVTGFLSRGKERAYIADKRILQAAVNAFRTDVTRRTGNPWPTLTGEVGTAAEGNKPGWQCDGRIAEQDQGQDPPEICSWIDIAVLHDDGYIDGDDAVASAKTSLNKTATNSPSGSYGWYIDVDGIVNSSPAFSLDVGYP